MWNWLVTIRGKAKKTSKIRYTERDAARDVRVSLMPKALTKEQEGILFKRIGYEDRRAREELIQANEFLVESVAKKYIDNDKGLTLTELKNLGMKGLIRAVDKYDPTKSYRFSVYSTWWIRQAIHLALGIEEE